MSMVAYIVQWEDHNVNVLRHLRVLYEEQKFVDVTLLCNTHSIKVHSVVIASNSSYFERVLLSQNGMNSVIVLKDMKLEVLNALIEFMYCGETTIMEEDIDALLYAAKKFEINGLSRMTRISFPAKPAQPGMIQAVIDISQKEDLQERGDNKKSASLYFQKTVLRRRGRPKVARSRENIIQETTLTDTEYAILKEAEESRRALENLQKYVVDSNPVVDSYVPEVLTKNSGSGPKRMKSDNVISEFLTKNDLYENDLAEMNEDEIAVKNLTEEINEQPTADNLLETVALSTDLPTFVDAGNGNYVALDDEVADMISGQEIKYHLMQGIVMTQDDGGNQFSNPANILVPETQFENNSAVPVVASSNRGGSEEVRQFTGDTGYNTLGESQNGYGNGHVKEPEKISTPAYENISSDTESDKDRSEKKPFVVKEMVRLSQPKKPNPNGNENFKNVTTQACNSSDLGKQCFDFQFPMNGNFITAFNSAD